jgi:hypothetical protein
MIFHPLIFDCSRLFDRLPTFPRREQALQSGSALLPGLLPPGKVGQNQNPNSRQNKQPEKMKEQRQ